MSQHDFNIANQLFPATRADLNNAFVALASNSSGDAEPGTTYANQWWYETDTNTLKLRNEANSAWIEIATLDQSSNNVLSITTQGLTLGATAITATATEINILDALTRGSLIYGNPSGVTSELVKGGAGTVLTSDGTDISWGAAGGGGLAFIASADASSSANLSFTGFDASKYDSYLFTCANIVPATDAAVFAMRMSVDGGSNYLSASDSYSIVAAEGYPAGDANILPFLYYSFGNVATEGASLDVKVNGPHLNTRTYVNAYGVCANASGELNIAACTGGTKIARVVDAVQFLFHSGNIASGTITMYGLVNA